MAEMSRGGSQAPGRLGFSGRRNGSARWWTTTSRMAKPRSASMPKLRAAPAPAVREGPARGAPAGTAAGVSNIGGPFLPGASGHGVRGGCRRGGRDLLQEALFQVAGNLVEFVEHPCAEPVVLVPALGGDAEIIHR